MNTNKETQKLNKELAMKAITNKLGLIFTLLTFLGLTACTNIPIDENPNPNVKGYVVQLVATNDASKAFNIKNTFVKEGYKNTTVNSITKDGKKIHRVQIGPFGTKSDGDRVLMKMKKRYQKNQYVNNAVVKTIYGK